MTDDVADGTPQPGNIDSTVPHSARIWNYWLGGKTTTPSTAKQAKRFARSYSEIVDVARAVRYLLAPCGPVPGGRGGHPPVPRCRHQLADCGQHP